MDPDDAIPNGFDAILDRVIRSKVVDPAAVVREHPELTEEERRLLFRLCGPRPSPGDGSATTDPFDAGVPAEAPPIASIGPIRLGRRIGAGAMAAVFLGHDESLGRDVAVKILGPDFAGEGERGARFLREVRAVARLRHPNIVTVYAAGEQDGVRYMTMEHVAGRSLHDVIAEAATRGTRLPWADVARWGAEIARALHAAHEAGIVHRDVKPSNVRIADDGRAVLLDFGLAQEAGAATLTETGSFRGSPQYASPEQVGAGKGAIDARTDVYSLGATLYEALTGVAPFRAETRERLFHQILTRDPMSLRRLDPSLPRDLDTVVLATLEKEPRRRHPTAAALASDLEAVANGGPISVRPPSAAGRAWRWARRKPAAAALVVAAAIGLPLVTALGGFIFANLPKIHRADDEERARRVAKSVEDGYLEYGEGDGARAKAHFEEALREDPASPEALAGYALALIERGEHAAALAFLDARAGDETSRAWFQDVRARALYASGSASRPAARATPVSPVDHFVLGMAELNRVHHGYAESAEIAFRHLYEAVISAPQAIATYHGELGHAAWHARRDVEAKAVARAIEALRPDSPERSFAIARTLLSADRDEAFRALEKAARDPPRSLQARAFIVIELSQSGRNAEALAAANALALSTVALDPSRGKSHVALAVSHLAQKDVEPALAAAREAVRVEPGLAEGHRILGHVLQTKGALAAALDQAHEATRLAPRDARAWNLQGTVLMNLAQHAEAKAAYERVLEIQPDDAAALCNLGKVLTETGEFEEGLARLRSGHEKGSKLPGWTNPSQRMVADAERLVSLEKRLRGLRTGSVAGLSALELQELAWQICRRKQLFAEAAALFSEAFELDPSLAAILSPDHVLAGALMAIQAGLGRGRDAPADEEGRARLRDSGRGWFEAGVAASEKLLADEPARAADVGARIAVWVKAPLFAGVRDREGLNQLPPEETKAWEAFWARCRRLSR